MRSAARVVFWGVLALIAVATLGPIGWRPETDLPTNVERWAGFALLGLPLTLAYPRYRVLSLLGLIVVAGILEALQNDVPGRHGRLGDFEVKVLGLFSGVLLGVLAERAMARFRPDRGPV